MCHDGVVQYLPVTIKSGPENFHPRTGSEGEEQAFLSKDDCGGGGRAVGEGAWLMGEGQSCEEGAGLWGRGKDCGGRGTEIFLFA